MRAHSSANRSSNFWSASAKAAGDVENISRIPVNRACLSLLLPALLLPSLLLPSLPLLSKTGTMRMERMPRRTSFETGARETVASIERDAEIRGEVSGGSATDHFVAADERESSGGGV